MTDYDIELLILKEEEETCLLQKNRTILFNTYEGIPETLFFNFIGWLSLLILFTILRKKAWDYGRLALVQVSDRWTRLFYGTIEEVNPRNDSDSNNTNGNGNSNGNSMNSILKLDQGCCTWILAVFKITDERVRTKCGPDALHYLSFQKHLLILSAIYTVIAITIVLPINFQGTLQDETSFGHTTISNLGPKNGLLWVHIILAFMYVPIAMYVMSRCTGRIANVEETSKTIMVTNISHAHRNQSDIFHYFRLLFKDITFKNVELAYDVARLTLLVEKLQRVSNARIQAETHFKKTGQRLRVNLYGCCGCCGRCPWGTEDAIEYYTREENSLLSEVDQERSRALSRPLGIAFVTVNSAEAADYIVKKFQPGTSRNWIISHAPAPSDIFWENLSVKSRFWYLKAITINVTLFMILFFLTTPIIIVNSVDSLYFVKEGIYQKINPVISEFLPTLLLCAMAALMPVIVSYSDQWLAYRTRSKQNHNIMQKTFFFLLLMTLILPSLGLTSAQAFVQWSLEPHNQTYRWECVFLPDKGAFFVNYVITSAMIGTALELMRFPELCMYVWCMVRAKSVAEIVSIRKAILLEYPFGVHYAWTLVIFTIVTTYSLICPLITPFGLLYLCLKHFVDRYNLYFAYGPSNMIGIGSDHIHANAVYLVRISLILLIATMAGFTVLRGGMDVMAITTIIGLIVAACGMFCFIRPCISRIPRISDEETNEPEPDYVAPVLHPNHFFEGNEALVLPVSQDYGSAHGDNMTRELIHNVTL